MAESMSVGVTPGTSRMTVFATLGASLGISTGAGGKSVGSIGRTFGALIFAVDSGGFAGTNSGLTLGSGAGCACGAELGTRTSGAGAFATTFVGSASEVDFNSANPLPISAIVSSEMPNNADRDKLLLDSADAKAGVARRGSRCVA